MVSPRTSWLKTREVMSQARTTAEIATAFSAAAADASDDAARATAIVKSRRRGAEEQATAIDTASIVVVPSIVNPGFPRPKPYSYSYDSLLQT
jgi:hypothetical protein